MEPITFDQALEFFNEDYTKMRTLGLQSHFYISSVDGFILLQNSRGNEMAIDKTHWDKVMKRIQELPESERQMTSRYAQGNNDYNWRDVPNRVFSLYIPAAVRYYHEKK